MSAPGYLLPTSTQPIPKSLTLVQFIQTVIAGVSGLPGTMVRPEWQPSPPKQPDLPTSWIAFGIGASLPDSNSYLGTNSGGSLSSQRHEQLEIDCSIYGPQALEIADLIRDGLQVPTNLEALRSADMGFVEISRILHVPDLVNERWIDRYRMSIVLRREVKRTYAVPTLISANGRIHTVLGDEEYLLEWQTEI